MARRVTTLDLDTRSDLESLANHAQASGSAMRLDRNESSLALARMERRRAAARRARPVTLDDPLFGLIGIGHSGIPGGVSAHKHEQLVRAHRS